MQKKSNKQRTKNMINVGEIMAKVMKIFDIKVKSKQL